MPSPLCRQVVGETNFKSIAKQIDLQLQASLGKSEPIDDATFLSRVSLDLVGRRPNADQIRNFVSDTDPRKRTAAIQQLLEDPQFGRHWGRYWRDTILARRADERALQLVSASLTTAVADRLNNNMGWDQIANDFITASGDVRGHGETALFITQKGEPEGITAEVSRIFLGMQIQCAQCHDHPTDRWKREQFHQLAAFFPRVGIRRVRNEEPRNFEVYSRNKQIRGNKNRNRNKKSLEYYMPDLARPNAQGQITKPVFFLTGHSLELGTQDQIRRQTLAEWITDNDENPWFARAYINRIWTELIGWGFYNAVDDIGPERDCTNPEILTLLEKQFVASDYDTKWLLQTILETAAYQSKVPATRTGSEVIASQPLRGDAIFNNLIQALAVPGSGRRNTKNQKRLQKSRQLFVQSFFYDPSLPRAEINPTIPQALLLMNSPQINAFIRGDRSKTMLRRLLVTEMKNERVVETLYLKCLGRFPYDQEHRICMHYIASQGSRVEACEDILWSLLNTAEFRQRN